MQITVARYIRQSGCMIPHLEPENRTAASSSHHCVQVGNHSACWN
jgi:hypothetical protein